MITHMWLRWSDSATPKPSNEYQRNTVRKMYRKWRTNKSRSGRGFGIQAGDGYGQSKERARSEALYEAEQWRY